MLGFSLVMFHNWTSPLDFRFILPVLVSGAYLFRLDPVRSKHWQTGWETVS